MTAEIPTKSAISVIAKPLADEKLCKKVLKLAKKGAKRKQIKRGVKEVVKALRKNTQGLASLLSRASCRARNTEAYLNVCLYLLQDLYYCGRHLSHRCCDPPSCAVRGSRHPIHLCALQGGTALTATAQSWDTLQHHVACNCF